MAISRRGFVGAAATGLIAVSAQAATPPSRAWATSGADRRQNELEKLHQYVEEHRAAYNLPGLTLCVVDAEGYQGFITSGYSDLEHKKPVDANQYFEIGSISKSFTGICIYRLIHEGKLHLDMDIREALPGLQIDTTEKVTLQSVLNHSSGLAEGPPIYPRVTQGKLWLGFKPGTHWSYSNTGYAMLGQIVETIRGETLETIFEREIFTPLGMKGAHGAIREEDRAVYAHGYSPEFRERPYHRGSPLAEARWSDFTRGSGSIAMTTPQMVKYMQWLINAGRGKGGPILDDAAAKAWTSPTVDAPGWEEGKKYNAKYANGLAVVTIDGRTLLHHTGGMQAFSSAIHVDAEAGIACFASTNVGSTGYRPRNITSYACGLFRTKGGADAPKPEPTTIAISKPGDYVGSFQSRKRKIEITEAGGGLQLSFPGGTVRLIPSEGGGVIVDHPKFWHYPLSPERKDGKLVALWYGDEEFVTDPSKLRGPAPPELQALAGRYDGGGGGGVTRVVARPTGLFIGGRSLTKLPDGSWRPGHEDWEPERVWFDFHMAGKAQLICQTGGDSYRSTDREET